MKMLLWAPFKRCTFSSHFKKQHFLKSWMEVSYQTGRWKSCLKKHFLHLESAKQPAECVWFVSLNISVQKQKKKVWYVISVQTFEKHCSKISVQNDGFWNHLRPIFKQQKLILNSNCVIILNIIWPTRHQKQHKVFSISPIQSRWH